MLNRLKLNNFTSSYGPNIEHIEQFNDCFVLKTCQRTLVLSYGNDQVSQLHQYAINAPADAYTFYEGKEAYAYLLEIICGLQSKMLGENEIVNQFKAAYKNYLCNELKSTKLLQIIEKLFQDAKEVRTKYLLGLSQKTYSSIARKHIVSKNKASSVLILGSGQLAEDLINQFKKKVNVFISARNLQAVTRLTKDHGINSVPWAQIDSFQRFPFIVNSIGFKGILLDSTFFNDWAQLHNKKLFIDLGSPCAIETHFNYSQGVMRLDDVFGEGAIHEDHKKKQIEVAKKAMIGIAQKRQEVFLKRSDFISNINSMNSIDSMESKIKIKRTYV